MDETIRTFEGTARPHVGLSTQDVPAARRFYELLLGVGPTKVREDYVKFESAVPPLNLSISRTSEPPRVGGAHYGIELRSVQAVHEAAARLRAAGIEPRDERATCCYAFQEKAWVTDPDGREWELFVALADTDVSTEGRDRTCCAADCCASS